MELINNNGFSETNGFISTNDTIFKFKTLASLKHYVLCASLDDVNVDALIVLNLFHKEMTG